MLPVMYLAARIRTFLAGLFHVHPVFRAVLVGDRVG